MQPFAYAASDQFEFCMFRQIFFQFWVTPATYPYVNLKFGILSVEVDSRRISKYGSGLLKERLFCGVVSKNSLIHTNLSKDHLSSLEALS